MKKSTQLKEELEVTTVAAVESCALKSAPPPQPSLKAYAFRLLPGTDLFQGISNVVETEQIQAGWIGTCVGSLVQYNIRFANQPNTTVGNGHFEIVSLVGTVSVNGSHIHISVSDGSGVTVGGHLAASNNTVYTTAEIVIFGSSRYRFERAHDGTTPWTELQVISL